jgi:hypothetical protein
MDVNEDDAVVNVDNNNPLENATMDTAINKNSNSRTSGGHSAATFWQHFNNNPEPQKLKSAVCKHCCIRYNHHNKKSEQAMIHDPSERISRLLQGNERH